MFMCHLPLNAGMNMGIMPITGIPLPFISYGGSFNMTALAAVGLLQSVALHRHRIMFRPPNTPTKRGALRRSARACC